MLVYIGLSSQHDMIKREEKREILDFYHLFLTRISHKGDQALSMATIVAADPRVQELLASRDWDSLLDYTLPIYIKLKKESEYHEMSYIDKRKKDRAFGRFIKLAKKQKKD